MSKEGFVSSLYNMGVFKFGKFKLSSGKTSSYYVDIRLIPSIPSVYSKAIGLFTSTVTRFGPSRFDCIVGVATAGLLFSIPLSLSLHMPMTYVRSERKKHGTEKKLEGHINENSKCIVVDDVATTGKSILEAVNIVSSTGGKVVAAFVFVDREEGAKENLKKIKVPLYSCFTVGEIFRILKTGKSELKH